MIRIVVHFAYGILCAVFLVAFLRYFHMPNDTSWFEMSQVIIPALCLVSIVSFLARGRMKLLILAICSGCFSAAGISTAVEMARRVADVGDDYVPSAPELLLTLVTIMIPLGMCLSAISLWNPKTV